MGWGDPPQQLLARERRERLLQGAAGLVRRGGLEAAGVDAVARHADLRPESVEFYFGGEDNLLIEVIRELLIRWHERIGQMLATLPPAGADVGEWEEAVGRLARGLVWLDAEGDLTIWEICEQAHRRSALARVAGESLDAVQDSISRLMVECGVPQGDLLGPVVCGMIHGLMSYYRVTGGDSALLLDDLAHGLLALISGHRSLYAEPVGS